MNCIEFSTRREETRCSSSGCRAGAGFTVQAMRAVGLAVLRQTETKVSVSGLPERLAGRAQSQPCWAFAYGVHSTLTPGPVVKRRKASARLTSARSVPWALNSIRMTRGTGWSESSLLGCGSAARPFGVRAAETREGTRTRQRARPGPARAAKLERPGDPEEPVAAEVGLGDPQAGAVDPHRPPAGNGDRRRVGDRPRLAPGKRLRAARPVGPQQRRRDAGDQPDGDHDQRPPRRASLFARFHHAPDRIRTCGLRPPEGRALSS